MVLDAPAVLLTSLAGRVLRPLRDELGHALDLLVPAVLRSVLDRVDLTRLVIERVDLDEVARHLDLDAAAARLDLDAAAARLDLDAAASRIDLDAILGRVDLIGLADYIIAGVDLPGIIRASTGSVASEGIRGVRLQTIDADERVNRVIDRLLLRRQGRRTDQPFDATPGANGDGT